MYVYIYTYTQHNIYTTQHYIHIYIYIYTYIHIHNTTYTQHNTAQRRGTPALTRSPFSTNPVQGGSRQRPTCRCAPTLYITTQSRYTTQYCYTAHHDAVQAVQIHNTTRYRYNVIHNTTLYKYNVITSYSTIQRRTDTQHNTIQIQCNTQHNTTQHRYTAQHNAIQTHNTTLRTYTPFNTSLLPFLIPL